MSGEQQDHQIKSWLQHTFGPYLISGKFADGILRITVIDKAYLDIPIHRVILASSSPWFDALFSSQPTSSTAGTASHSLPIWNIEIGADQEQAIQRCIEYMYLSTTHIDFSSWIQCLRLARQFGLPRVGGLCFAFIQHQLDLLDTNLEKGKSLEKEIEVKAMATATPAQGLEYQDVSAAMEYFTSLTLDNWAQILHVLVESLYFYPTAANPASAISLFINRVLERGVLFAHSELDAICLHLGLQAPHQSFKKYLLVLCALQILPKGVDGCVLIKCVCIEGWSEGELYWARKDGILNADNIARELENAQIREISALEIGIEEGMQMGVQMGMRIEEEMGMRIEKEMDLDETIRAGDFGKGKERVVEKKSGDAVVEDQLLDASTMEKVGVQSDEQDIPQGEAIETHQEHQDDEHIKQYTDMMSHKEVVYEWPEQRQRRSSAQTLPESTFFDPVENTVARAAEEPTPPPLPLKNNDTTTTIMIAPSSPPLLYAPRPQRSIDLKPPDFVSNESLLQVMAANPRGSFHGVSFASSFLRKGDVEGEVREGKEEAAYAFHQEDGVLPCIPYSPLQKAGLLESIHATLEKHDVKGGGRGEERGGGGGGNRLSYSDWSGDALQYQEPPRPHSTNITQDQQSHVHHAIQQPFLLDRDSTPKATLLNPPSLYQSQHHYFNNNNQNHNRYYSESTQYSTTATASGSIRSSATNTRSIHPVSALPARPLQRPSVATKFLNKFKSSRAYSVNELTANQHRGLRTFDLEKQQRSSWQFDQDGGGGGGGGGVEEGQGSGSPGTKKKGLGQFFKGLF